MCWPFFQYEQTVTETSNTSMVCVTPPVTMASSGSQGNRRRRRDLDEIVSYYIGIKMGY